jgi:hypothetical protein
VTGPTRQRTSFTSSNNLLLSLHSVSRLEQIAVTPQAIYIGYKNKHKLKFRIYFGCWAVRGRTRVESKSVCMYTVGDRMLEEAVDWGGSAMIYCADVAVALGGTVDAEIDEAGRIDRSVGLIVVGRYAWFRSGIGSSRDSKPLLAIFARSCLSFSRIDVDRFRKVSWAGPGSRMTELLSR